MEKEKFDYGKHVFLFFRNLIYGALIAILAFWILLVIGLLIIPEQTQCVIEILKSLF